MAGIVSITCILAFIYRPIVSDSDREQQNVNRKQGKKFWDISILKHKVFLLCTMSGAVFYLSHYIPPMHMEASRLYIYSGLASLLVRPLIGRLNDVSWINMLYIYSVAAAIEGVVTILLPLATTNVHFILYFVVYGLCDGTLGCGLTIVVLNSLPDTLKPLGFSTYNSWHILRQHVVRFLEVL
ncbi:hypothetical protein OS493_040097 [Desmophyllum pertusum]|uniref:Uncharacterized protein n=1 Tax=Desmophyllum pertusum TaxID=174260 RepID=A0A9W9Z725_9CNID|nr:hypothetical protein OS493_040097 [Desmophyllum pertusum]